MSQHSSYTFSLIILFVSINVLPMHDQKLSRDLAYSKNAEQNCFNWDSVDN